MTPIAPLQGLEPRLASVVVLYHPDDLAAECLAAAADAADGVFVVDNTPGGSALDLPATAVALHRGENIGLACAYNLAAAAAERAGFTHLVLLDQDTVLLAGYRAAMLGALRAPSGRPVAALGPLFVNWRAPELSAGGGDGTIADVDMVISSGSVIPLAAWRALGGFDEPLFVDSVDIEYCLRARRRGWAVRQVQVVLMRHGLARPGVNSVFGRRRASSNYPPLRHYYLNRNFLLTARHTGGLGWFLRQLPRRTRMNLLTLAMEPQRPEKLAAMVRGTFDGLRNRGGAATAGGGR